MGKWEDEVFGKEYEETDFADKSETDVNDCHISYYRDIYKGGFPNCAATVEDGSWCDKNDACTLNAIRYQEMEGCYLSDCKKAWK